MITVAAVLVILTVLLLVPVKKAKIQQTTSSEPQTSETQQTTAETTDAVQSDTSAQAVTTAAIADAEYNIQNSIILQGTRAMEMYGISQPSLQSYAGIINSLAEKCPAVKVYSLLAPTQVEFYGPEKYRTGSRSQKDGIAIAYSAMNSNVTTVDAWSALASHTDEYLYFRTDHHWTARGAYYAYTAFAKAAGLSATQPISSYQTGKVDGFVGSMYGFSGKAQVLADNPDYIEYFMPLNDASGEILGVDGNGNLTGANSPLKIVNPNGTSYAGVFIQGDQALCKIVTANKNGRKILLIKESYGNCFAPFLTENYEEIYILDPRKDGVKNMSLPSFIQNQGINEVLVLNYTLATSNKYFKEPLTNIINK